MNIYYLKRELFTQKEEIIKNKIQAVNELRADINKIVPLLVERLNKGFKVKVNGTLFDKDAKDVKEIIEKNTSNKKHRIFFKIDKYNIKLDFDTNYRVSADACNYHNETKYIYQSNNEERKLYNDALEPLKMFDYESIMQANKRIKEMQEIVKKYDDEAEKIIKDNDFYDFFN